MTRLDVPIPVGLRLAIVGGLSSCVTPPIVQNAGVNSVDAARLDVSAEVVEAETEDGVTLRGLYLPGPPGAPLVVHFLPSGASITTGFEAPPFVFPLDEGILRLRDLGFASLALDYRGVGASGGSRRPDRIAEDALAMWKEGLRRVDGHGSRIVLRGVSLGSLAVATLLERGEDPGAAVVIAPIRAETIGLHGARRSHGRILGSLASLFLRRPTDTDLRAALATCTAPSLRIQATDDPLISSAEQAEIERAALARGHDAEWFEGSHSELAWRSYGWEIDETDSGFEGAAERRLCDVEEAFLARFVTDPPIAE